jgi:hypothetical protein
MRWTNTILVAACLSATAYGQQQCPPTPSKLSFGKGEYVSRPGIVFTLENFVAEMVPKGKASPQCFIKETHIEHGRVYVSAESLTKLFRERVQNGGSNESKQKQSNDAKDDSKKDNGGISDVTIRTKGNELDLSGKKKGKIPVSFDLIGPVDIVDPHTLRLHVDKIKTAGISSKKLLKLFGFHLSKMLQPGSTNGVVVQDDAILVNTEAIANVKGEISHVQVSGDDLVVDFVSQTRQQIQKAEAQKPEPQPKGEQSHRHIASVRPLHKK